MAESESYHSYHKRQITLSEIGREGQDRLKSASVLIVGLGGLGIPALQYLSGSGIGRLGVVDYDVVEISNLSRQPMYSFDDVGRLKVEVVQEKMERMNPMLELVSYQKMLTADNAVDQISSFDVIIDATDNFTAKFLIHDVCFLLEKKLVQGALYQYEGLLRSFDFSNIQQREVDEFPCFRCLWTVKPIEGCTDNCDEAGIVPATAGIVGSFQAMETIKLVLGWNQEKRPLEYALEFRNFSLRKMSWSRNKTCPLCSFFQLRPLKLSTVDIRLALEKILEQDRKNLDQARSLELDFDEVEKLKSVAFVDVRRSDEIKEEPLSPLIDQYKKNSQNERSVFTIIVKEEMERFLKDRKFENYVLVCQSGVRSWQWLESDIVKKSRDIYSGIQFYSLKRGIKSILKEIKETKEN